MGSEKSTELEHKFIFLPLADICSKHKLNQFHRKQHRVFQFGYIYTFL